MANLNPHLPSPTEQTSGLTGAKMDTPGALNTKNGSTPVIPTPEFPATTEAQPVQVNARPIEPDTSTGMGRWFRYFFGPLFGVLNEQELRTVSQVKSGIRNLERALKAGNQPLSNNGLLIQMKAHLDFAEAQVAALNNLSRDTNKLARDFHRYADFPAEIAKLRDKTIHLRHQYEFGVSISGYARAVQNYSRAVETHGLRSSWDAFQNARGEMKAMAEDLIGKIENDPTLNQKRSIQSMIRKVRVNDSKGGALLALARHSYPQYEKFLRSLFTKTVQFSRERFSHLKGQIEYLNPLLGQYNAQLKEVARLEAIINDHSNRGIFARIFYNSLGGNREQQLEAAKKAVQHTLDLINLNRFSTNEEIVWLRNISETSSEARKIFDSIAPTMGKIYQINASYSEEHVAARASIALDLDALIAELKQRTPNQDNVKEHLSAIVGKIGDIHGKYRTECVLPRNFEKLNDFQKLETLMKVHLPGLETQTAEIASLAKKKRLTQDINTKISASVTEYNQARKSTDTHFTPHHVDEDVEGDSLTRPVSITPATDYANVGEVLTAELPASDDISASAIPEVVSPVAQSDQNAAVGPIEATAEPEQQLDDLGHIIPLAPSSPPLVATDAPSPPPPPPPPSTQKAFTLASNTVFTNQLSSVSLRKAADRPASIAVSAQDSSLVGIFGQGLDRARLPKVPEDVPNSDSDDEWSDYGTEDGVVDDATTSASGASKTTESTLSTGTDYGTEDDSNETKKDDATTSANDASKTTESTLNTGTEIKENPEERKARLKREQEELIARQTSMIAFAAGSLQKRRQDMKEKNTK